MTLPRLYVITDEKLLPNHLLPGKIEEVLSSGVRLLQLRFKQTSREEQLKLGKEIRLLTRTFDSILIVNDSPELARAIQADGVHLGAGDPDVSYARKLLGEEAIIGVSCYEDINMVRCWSLKNISYIGLSSPYPSSTKSKAVVSDVAFTKLVRASRVPVYAIGGVTPERVAGLMSSGCYGVAVISAIFGSMEPSKAARRFLEEIGESAK